MERRKTLARIVCVVIAATLVAIFAGGQRTSAASTETVTVEIPPTCCGTPGTQSSPQLAFSEDITTQGVLIVEYLVSLAHCSSIRLHVSVDGVEVSTTEFLGYLGDPLGRPMTTGPIDLGPVSSGTHTVTLLPEGTLGGCNGGTLHAWKGTLLVTLEPEPDTDGDGVPDDDDGCPYYSEDLDGFKDDDGCPENGGSSKGIAPGIRKFFDRFFKDEDSKNLGIALKFAADSQLCAVGVLVMIAPVAAGWPTLGPPPPFMAEKCADALNTILPMLQSYVDPPPVE